MAGIALFQGHFAVAAEGKVAAAPAGAVTAEPLPAERRGDRPVVIELFSSQACVFCPQADRLFADLTTQPGVIGLACHIDYFDVRQGSLSKPFCTARQSWYMRALNAGPNYTPQIVMDGQKDIVGYHTDEVAGALQQSTGVGKIGIRPDGNGKFKLSFQQQDGQTLPSESLRIWLALYDKPHTLTVASGRNKGQKMTYKNIVSDFQDLGFLESGIAEKTVTPKLQNDQAGFVVLLQDEESGAILAAGQYKEGK